jgi:hypothetical protein
MYATCPANLILFLPLPHSDPDVPLSTLFSYTLDLRSSVDVPHRIWNPYKTTDNIFLNILNSSFWGSRLKDQVFWTEWQQAFPESNALPREGEFDLLQSFRNV